MSITDTLQADLGLSMKAHDTVRTGVLRLVRSSLKNEAIKLGRELDDAEALKVLMREAKQRRDSIEQYRAANRADLAEVEEAELDVIGGYLPQALSTEELDELVTTAITETKAEGPAATGQVIAHVMRTAGARVEGGEVAAAVKARLGRQMTARGLTVDIIGDKPEFLDISPLRRAIAVVVDRQKELGMPAGIVNLLFVENDAMQELNRTYSGNDYVTDVLSFDYLETGEAIDGVVGEIAIAYVVAQQQAQTAGTSWADECALLAVHGLLHVGGHDHQTTAEQTEVQSLQKQILEKANVQYREFSWQD